MFFTGRGLDVENGAIFDSWLESQCRVTGRLWCILLKCTWVCFARITDSWAGFSHSRHLHAKVYTVIIRRMELVVRDVECVEMGTLFFVWTTASIPKSTEPLSVHLITYEAHLSMFV